MKSSLLSLAMVLFFCPAALAQENNASRVLITGARLLDVANGRLIDGRAVLLEGDRIAAIGDNQVSADLVLHLEGLILAPGLIDLHSHLLLRPYDQISWDDQVLKESLELRTIRAVGAAQANLEAGFTTLRDLGTEGAGFADVALRDAIAMRLIRGPRVLAVTRALVTSGGYGPMGFDPRWDVPKGAQVADGVMAVRKATREQIAAGADWIKVYADYRRRPGGESTATFSLEELKAIVDEATSAGLPVSAHATTDQGMRRAVLAGVKTIEHGYEASDEILRLMKENQVVLCPTLAANEAMAIYGGWRPDQPDHPRIATAKAMMRRAIENEVVIACGSDVGVFPHGTNARELELMHAYGMSRADVIRAATSVAAQVIGREDDLGKIAPGCYADLIALASNPLEDISALRQPVIVIQAGELIIDRRADGAGPKAPPR